MKYRKLRIAWSVTWGVVAVLLAVLWVRSYWRLDFINYRMGHAVMSTKGKIQPVEIGYALAPDKPLPLFESNSTPFNVREQEHSFLGFGYTPGKVSSDIVIPHWFAVFTATALAVCGGVRPRCRFSLRTLLLATTVIATLLGLIVWLRK